MERSILCFLMQWKYFHFGILFRIQKDFNIPNPFIQNEPRKREYMFSNYFHSLETNLINPNAQNLKKVQIEQIDTNKQQSEYIKGQIFKIRNSVENGHIQFVWQWENIVCGRENTSRAKQKNVNLDERLQNWKKNLIFCLQTLMKSFTNIFKKSSMANTTSN